MRELVAEAPTSIRYLMRLGAAFDPDADGDGPALTREGGHSHNRIVHSGGDRSGAEVQRTLDESAMAAGVDVLERAFALDLVCRRRRGRHAGRRPASRSPASTPPATSSRSASSRRAPSCSPPAATARSSPRRRTRRPSPATASAIALRAGLAVRDVEFVQFHPTVMWRGPGRHRPAGARQRGRPRRGGDPLRRRRRAGDGRRPPARGPRAARRRRRGDQPAHGRGTGRRRRPRLPRRHPPRRALLHPLPVDHRGVPGDRHRPGPRPHPRRPRRPLRLRRRAGPPRRDDGAAPGCTPSARCRAPACTAPTGWRRTA